jgi:hypothetical protein
MGRPAILTLCVVAAFGCAKEQVRGGGGCHTNADCHSGFVCDPSTGACRSPFTTCMSDADCPENTFCNSAEGNCIDSAHCTADVQCPFDSICDTTVFQCVPGCHEAGDCNLGKVCRCKDGTVPASDGGSCETGLCLTGTCDDDTDCDYGDLCEPDDMGINRCVLDTRGPYCQGCAYEPGAITHCGNDAANFCLVDRKVDYYMTYCGVDCSQGQACPFGYSCQNVLILTRGLCQQDSDCPVTGPPCTSLLDCEGARCDLATGHCAGKCSFNEDSLQGYCTCTSDADCPTDSCDVTSRTCTLSRQPCTLNGDECSHQIYCSKAPDKSACYIGANCKPSLGLTCTQVLAGTPTP